MWTATDLIQGIIATDIYAYARAEELFDDTLLESWAAIERDDETTTSAHRVENEIRTAVPEVELYDSGVSRHMSPHRQRFTT